MIYDALLLVAVIFIAGFAFNYATNFPQHPGLLPIFRLYLLAIIAAYFCWFWCKSGQTLAMKTWRIKLENPSGRLLSPLQGLIRFALALVGICLGGITILWALVDREKQFLHDRLMGNRLTIVASQE
jgi:uncharacterized RDD family membrane protein YckC